MRFTGGGASVFAVDANRRGGADAGGCPDENAKTRFLSQLKVVFGVD